MRWSLVVCVVGRHTEGDEGRKRSDRAAAAAATDDDYERKRKEREEARRCAQRLL